MSRSENAEQRYKDDVVVVKLGFAMQHRSFSFGEGIRGMRPFFSKKMYTLKSYINDRFFNKQQSGTQWLRGDSSSCNLPKRFNAKFAETVTE